MKAKISLTFVALFFIFSAIGQQPLLELTFTAFDDDTHIQLDSILIRNDTQGGDTLLYWPDTTLVLYDSINDTIVGIQRAYLVEGGLKVSQNYPNPVVNQTTISIFVPEEDKLHIVITDLMGRVVLTSDWSLASGHHSFRFTPGENGFYFFNAFWQGTNSSIKILSAGNASGRKSFLEHTGSKIANTDQKMTDTVQNFPFILGDKLLYIGYAQTGLGVSGSDVLVDEPINDSSYVFEISEGIPCANIPKVLYKLRLYNTVQIGTQCWLKESLNAGTMILGIIPQLDNEVLEKYCFDDDQANCEAYGGLYQWGEAMKYAGMDESRQGICPLGWHIPSDDEWKQLEGTVDSQYGYPDPEWDKTDYRGYDVGTRLKSRETWESGDNNSNAFGFSALATGTRRYDGVFLNMGSYSGIWSSSPGSTEGAWYRFMEDLTVQVNRTFNLSSMGRPVRCLKDE